MRSAPNINNIAAPQPIRYERRSMLLSQDLSTDTNYDVKLQQEEYRIIGMISRGRIAFEKSSTDAGVTISNAQASNYYCGEKENGRNILSYSNAIDLYPFDENCDYEDSHFLAAKELLEIRNRPSATSPVDEAIKDTSLRESLSIPTLQDDILTISHSQQQAQIHNTGSKRKGQNIGSLRMKNLPFCNRVQPATPN